MNDMSALNNCALLGLLRRAPSALQRDARVFGNKIFKENHCRFFVGCQ
jgi:hypothetical protein